MEKLELLCRADWCRAMENGMVASLNTVFPQDPAIPLLDISSEELKVGIQNDIIFEHPCVIAAYSQQLEGRRNQGSINNEWMNKMRSLHRMDPFALKREQL